MKMKQDTMRRLVLVVLLIVTMAVFTYLSPYFLTTNNLSSILREASGIGIIAIGMTFVIITAGIDLSVGSIVAFVAMLCVNFMNYTSIPVIIFLPIAILVGAFLGFVNGFIITKFKMPDFIVTLAMMGVLRGMTTLISIKQNGIIRNVVIQNKSFVSFAGKISGIYYVAIAFAVLAIIGHLLLKHTRFGTYTYAIGANLKSSKLSGINDKKTKILVYTFSGAMCAIAAIFLSARLMTATPSMGSGMEMDVIAAVVVGGTAFSGGRGDILGTVIGALFMAVIQNGIYKFHISAAYQSIIMGVIVVIAVMFDEWYKGRIDNKVA
ncbi:ABC transporter permease [Clostridium sp. DL1XJH146]